MADQKRGKERKRESEGKSRRKRERRRERQREWSMKQVFKSFPLDQQDDQHAIIMLLPTFLSLPLSLTLSLCHTQTLYFYISPASSYHVSAVACVSFIYKASSKQMIFLITKMWKIFAIPKKLRCSVASVQIVFEMKKKKVGIKFVNILSMLFG